jgi:membrane protein YqaA with SNARE-associated domain
VKLFEPLYALTLRWARHPKAPWYLGGMSFVESSFFPIPPDVMLMPMSLAHPERAMRYAWITTIFSTLGGLFGYLIGWLLFDMVEPLIESAGYMGKYQQVVEFFDLYGVPD